MKRGTLKPHGTPLHVLRNPLKSTAVEGPRFTGMKKGGQDSLLDLSNFVDNRIPRLSVCHTFDLSLLNAVHALEILLLNSKSMADVLEDTQNFGRLEVSDLP